MPMTRSDLIDTLGNVLVGAPDDRANAALSEAIALLSERPTMTRDEIDAKLTDAKLLEAERAAEKARNNELTRLLRIGDPYRLPPVEAIGYAAMRAVLSSALQGEPERGKTCATCRFHTEWDWTCGRKVLRPGRYPDGIPSKTFGCTLFEAQPDPPPPSTEGDRP